MNEIDPKALFRLSVLGPVVSRERLERGELQQLIRELAQREYAIPGTRVATSPRRPSRPGTTAWRKRRASRGWSPRPASTAAQSKITPAIQEAVLAAKRENPRRSIRQIVRLLEAAGIVASQSLSRSAVHRLLQQSGLSKLAGASSAARGEAQLHRRIRRLDLVWRRDARPARAAQGAAAQDVSGVAVRRRLAPGGAQRVLPWRDGAGHRRRAQAGTVEERCAHPHGGRQRRCLPRQYAAGHLCPTGHPPDFLPPLSADQQGEVGALAPNRKRDLFLSELDERRITDLDELNARLWAWLEQVYHRTPHAGLGGMTPLARYQRDLPQIRTLGAQGRAARCSVPPPHQALRAARTARCRTWAERFEVPYELSGKTVRLVVDPHAARVVGVEDDTASRSARPRRWTPIANIKRTRRKPEPAADTAARNGPNLVEIAHARTTA